jgi:hypothetical protein
VRHPSGKKSRRRAVYGDFQTPESLARAACRLLVRKGIKPSALVEPTCGRGSFLVAALEAFPDLRVALGLDVNPAHVAAAQQAVGAAIDRQGARVLQANFFETDWKQVLGKPPEPVLVLGNLPWVTNAELGAFQGSNVPQKSNFQNHRGIEAITGKSNFDISEWMLLRLLEALDGREAILAMLCKTAVARKALSFAWSNGLPLASADLYRIDAARCFEVSVDACLLVVRLAPDGQTFQCGDYADLQAADATTVFGHRDGRLVANLAAYDRWKHLEGSSPWRWRSGIKHDCAKVFELRKEGTLYRNGFGRLVELERDYLYPLLKSSDLAATEERKPQRWLLVTQRTVGEDTALIQQRAPKTWQYLNDYADRLDARGSSIYRGRPRFSVFGVGAYTFAPWKVALSGFYKQLRFRLLGPFRGKPVVLDDTCNFLACATRAEAAALTALLNGSVAQEYFSAFVFWDAKRPVTVDLLQRLDLKALGNEVGVGLRAMSPAPVRQRTRRPKRDDGEGQGLLFP